MERSKAFVHLKGTSSGGLGGLNDLNFGGNAVPATGNTPSSNVKQNENDDFFNQQQQQATNVDDGKMSKDSILALFAKTNAPAGNNMMTNHNSNGSSIFGQQMFPQGNTSGGLCQQNLLITYELMTPFRFRVSNAKFEPTPGTAIFFWSESTIKSVSEQS